MRVVAVEQLRRAEPDGIGRAGQSGNSRQVDGTEFGRVTRCSLANVDAIRRTSCSTPDVRSCTRHDRVHHDQPFIEPCDEAVVGTDGSDHHVVDGRGCRP